MLVIWEDIGLEEDIYQGVVDGVDRVGMSGKKLERLYKLKKFV